MVAWRFLFGHFPWYPTVQPIPFRPLALHRPPWRNFLTLKKREVRASETSVSTYSPKRFQNPEYIYQYQTRESGMLPAYMWEVSISDPSHYTDYISPLNAELSPICHLLALLGGATIVVFSRLRVKVFSFFICSGPPDTFRGVISNYVRTYFLYIISSFLVTVILLL